MLLEKVGDVTTSALGMLKPRPMWKSETAWYSITMLSSVSYWKGLMCQQEKRHENLFPNSKSAVLHMVEITRITSLILTFSASVFREKSYSKQYTALEEVIIPSHSTPFFKSYQQKLLRAGTCLLQVRKPAWDKGHGLCRCAADLTSSLDTTEHCLSPPLGPNQWRANRS